MVDQGLLLRQLRRLLLVCTGSPSVCFIICFIFMLGRVGSCWHSTLLTPHTKP